MCSGEDAVTVAILGDGDDVFFEGAPEIEAAAVEEVFVEDEVDLVEAAIPLSLHVATVTRLIGWLSAGFQPHRRCLLD